MRKPAAVVSAIFVAALCLVTSPSASAGNTTWFSVDKPPVIDSYVIHKNVRASTASPLAHAIVFTRFLPGADNGSVYRIDAGTTVEHLIRSGVLDFALLSPDATQFADIAFTSEGATTAIFNVDGSGYRRLPTSVPAIPPNGLPGGTWSGGETSDRRGSGRPGEHPTERHLLQALIRRQGSDPADRRRDSIRLSGGVLAGWVQTPVLPTRR